MKDAPVTVTAAHSARSAGGPHDYFSEGDYWWPDPQNPDGPYIQKDGLSNPGNFNDHRRALMRFSVQMPAAMIVEVAGIRSEEHTSELQSHVNLVCRLLLEKKKKKENH